MLESSTTGPAATAPAVRVEALSFTYSTRLRAALTDLTFAVDPGETVLVLGPSGSGKSTLTLCLDGLIPHLVEGDYSGEAVVAGLVVKDTPVGVLARETGLVFQDPDSQFCTLTVDDEIAFGLENLLTPPADIEGAIDRALGVVRLSGLRGRPLTGLSGGEKQRVALAAVLAMGPHLLVLDEPSANLDPAATAELFQIVRELAADRRHTILIIEHKLDEVIDWVDSVLVLDGEGRLLHRGEPRGTFYEHHADLVAAGVWRPQTVELVAGLGQAGWRVPGRPLGVKETAEALKATPGLVERLRVPVSARVGSGRGPAAPVSAEAAPLLDVRGLSFTYRDGHRALADVSLSIWRQEFVAIAGANGAGKTTLGSLLSGVLAPPRGTVYLEGEDAATLPAWAIAGKVGYVFQNPEHQFVTATVRGELAFSLSPQGRGRPGHLSPEQERSIEEWLERLNLLRLAEANPFSLSQGQKRRLGVAAMLIRGCPVLILDEPTLGQDAVQSARLMDMMVEFQRGGGTVAMITHDMRIVADYASRVLVLAGGRLIYTGSPAGLFAQPGVVAEARLSLPAVAEVGLRLEATAAIREGLLTARAFLEAARQGPSGTCSTAGLGPLAATEADAEPASGARSAPGPAAAAAGPTAAGRGPGAVG
jgi:energy-coupling factor transport system ATP-binding protein